ncbi:autotransporter domain-containing protein [Roseomonas sp. GC11]|nr:autotransporter domain-containing protein [Roseomonas sp. GC11]
MLSSGSSSASSYTIGSGGTLSGSGTIGGLVVENGGLAAPGYSPGTLNVSGHVTFNAGSTYQVEVLTDGTHDQILASGTATLLGGTVAVVAESGYAIPYASYVILRADGGVSGTFGTVTSNLAFLTPLLSYDATSVSLVLARNDVSFTSLARTANQRATATAVQALGLGNTVHDRVLAQTTSGAATSFDALSGEIHASLPGLFSRQSRFLRDAVGARLRQGGTPGEGDDNGGGDAGPATRHSRLGGLTAWGQGFGNWSRAGSDGNAAALSATLGGMVLGLDAPLGAHWRAGLVTGGSRTSFRAGARGASGDSDNLDLGLYLGGQYGALGLLAGGAYTWHDIGTKRRIAFPGYASTARADYDAGTAQLFGEVHYRLPLGGLQVQPFAGLAHVRVDGGAFGERDSTAALRGSAGTVETTYTTLGLRAEGGVTLGGLALRPQASLGWQHAFGDTAGSAALAFQGGGPEFRVGGLPLARDSAILGAGLSHSLSPQLSLSISYQGQFGGEVRSNGVKGNLTYSF